jgi:hypothetical protein
VANELRWPPDRARDARVRPGRRASRRRTRAAWDDRAVFMEYCPSRPPEQGESSQRLRWSRAWRRRSVRAGLLRAGRRRRHSP